jgi:UDP-2,4-diacetamido-2,4,6-trideoxy-beta-L-altropyranose hydrolase
MTVTASPLLIRADAGIRMGTGHVMRCLALAQAWQDAGGRVVYAMAACSAGLAQRLQSEQIEVVSLAVEPGSAEDAEAAAELARKCGAAWIVVDGYHFPASYQKLVKQAGRLLLLDDFGAADHYWADLVLNYDPIAEERLYLRREPYTRLLLGTTYAFLRREFRRHARAARPTPPTVSTLLVTLGGSDPDNLTIRVIEALEAMQRESLETIVLVGPSNPHGAALEAKAAASGLKIRLLRNPADIPELMAQSDMAVAAAGSTIWELAYFGVPSILAVVADNQTPVVRLLRAGGACEAVGETGETSPQAIAAAISGLADDLPRRRAMSERFAALVDGRGVVRVCEAMCP